MNIKTGSLIFCREIKFDMSDTWKGLGFYNNSSTGTILGLLGFNQLPTTYPTSWIPVKLCSCISQQKRILAVHKPYLIFPQWFLGEEEEEHFDFLKRALKPAHHKPRNPCEVFMAVTSSAGRKPTSWQLLNRLGSNSCQVSYLASSGTGCLQTVSK